MPRLTFNRYLDQRAFLRLAWDEFDQLYSLLPANQQADLHRYYQPVHDYSDDHLRDYRAHITKTDLSLPARAGRLYAQLHRVYEQAIALAKRPDGSTQPFAPPSSRRRKPIPASSRQVTVRAVVRPEPDLHLLSQALIEVAKDQAAKEQHQE